MPNSVMSEITPDDFRREKWVNGLSVLAIEHHKPGDRSKIRRNSDWELTGDQRGAAAVAFFGDLE